MKHKVKNYLGNNMASAYSKIDRYKRLLRYFFEKYKPRCYFCNELLDWKTFYHKFGFKKDNITEHHIDLNHSNGLIDNRELSHRVCHKGFHRRRLVE